METGVVFTAGRYGLGYGGRYDEDGNVLVPPVKIPGIQWDQDQTKEPGFLQGLYDSRSVVVENPRVYKDDDPFSYHWWGNSCTTYARDAWFFYSGEYCVFFGPGIPSVYRSWIQSMNRTDVANRIRRANREQGITQPIFQDWLDYPAGGW